MGSMRLANAVALLLMLPACSTPRPDTAAPQTAAICFTHAPSQGQPMPEFCALKPATGKDCDDPVEVPAGLTPTLLSSKAWTRVLEIVQTPATASAPAGPAELGQYRATLYPEAAVRYLDREAIRSIAGVVADDSRAAQRPEPAEVSRLMRRLPR